jgi:uncharacterized protein
VSVDGLSDQDVRNILEEAKTFAVVGASPKPDRPSYGVMGFLIDAGYEVKPVNPGIAGDEIHGATVYPKLSEVPASADVIDIFRASDAALGAVREAIAEKDRLGARVVWMQLGVVNEAAAAEARAAGLTVVMDRCPKIEFARLMRR